MGPIRVQPYTYYSRYLTVNQTKQFQNIPILNQTIYAIHHSACKKMVEAPVMQASK